MQAEEFINIACNSGYATKKNAKKLSAYRIPTPRFIEKRASGSGCYQNPQLWKNSEADWKPWSGADFYYPRESGITEKATNAGYHSAEFHYFTWCTSASKIY